MRTKIICEIASSHNGDIELAKALIKSAAINGADLVKFQDWRALNVSINDPDKARYVKYQFPDSWYPILIPYCKEQGVKFLTTCFNVERVKFLAAQGLQTIKLASISLTNLELIQECCKHFSEIILSTSMHEWKEIANVINFLDLNAQDFTIMVCTANYPTVPEEAHLERLNTLKHMIFDCEQGSIGFSNHALDLDVPKMALCNNIKYLEVHFSLSRHLPQISHTMFEGGKPMTTHEISLEPHELKELADWRDKVEIMKGDGEFHNNLIENLIKDKYANRYGK